MITIIVESLFDPLWQIGGGILVVVALMFIVALRSPEMHLSAAHKQRGTLLVLVSGLCCVLILSGAILWSHAAAQASSSAASIKQVHRSSSVFLPTGSPTPRPTPQPSPTPLPVLTPSTVQVLTTWCTAINRQETATVWSLYSASLQQQLLSNKTQMAAQDQRKIVHCQVNDLNEWSAVGYLMLTTVDGNGHGDGIERPYQLTLKVEHDAWKISIFSFCTADACLDVTPSIVV